jgi:hypothetical protein
MRLRLSRVGFVLAITFLCVAGALFALHFHAYRTNPANSGESALWFFLCTLPWAFLVPESVIDAPWWDDVADYAGWLFVAWNAFLLYCLGGGLAVAPRAAPQPRRSSFTSR